MARHIIMISIGLVFTFHFLISCKKEASYQSNAELIGYDPRLCPSPCCGGLQITIDNLMPTDSAQFFLVYQLPNDFSLGANPNFPVSVKIDYKIDSTHCSKNYVDISRIAFR
jgi:hypothetical protein